LQSSEFLHGVNATQRFDVQSWFRSQSAAATHSTHCPVAVSQIPLLFEALTQSRLVRQSAAAGVPPLCLPPVAPFAPPLAVPPWAIPLASPVRVAPPVPDRCPTLAEFESPHAAAMTASPVKTNAGAVPLLLLIPRMLP
jgi:hypothetical protein